MLSICLSVLEILCKRAIVETAVWQSVLKKYSELTAEQKQFNKELAKERVVIEHIIRHLRAC